MGRTAPALGESPASPRSNPSRATARRKAAPGAAFERERTAPDEARPVPTIVEARAGVRALGGGARRRTLDKPGPRRHAATMTEPDASRHPDGERIAKVLARAGVASRREAERMIEAGRVSVNGRRIDSPALDVAPTDRIRVDGRDLAAAEPPRLWLYHKPPGLVTTASDERGRPTVFAALPADMPRVMSVGRLDLTSEGLLLLTNDGGLKRRMELPSTGWLRRYRVRVHGAPQDAALEPLRRGLVLGGERFQPMDVSVDRQQGANAWLTISLREGRNREIRRAMEAVGLRVNRLIRVSYGPFQLGGLAPGAVEEVRPRVLRDQLGLAEAPAGAPARAEKPPRAERRSLKRAGSAPDRSAARAARASVEPEPAGGTDRGSGRPDRRGPGAKGAGGGRPAGPRRKGPRPEPPALEPSRQGRRDARPRPASAGEDAGPGTRPPRGDPAKPRTLAPRGAGSGPRPEGRGGGDRKPASPGPRRPGPGGGPRRPRG